MTKQSGTAGKTENRRLTPDEIALLASLIIDEPDHYTVLGVDQGASSDEICRAYCVAIQYFHPLKCRDIIASDSVMQWKLSRAFIRVQDAFAILSNQARRKTYDEVVNRQKGNALAAAQLSQTRGPGVKKRSKLVQSYAARQSEFLKLIEASPDQKRGAAKTHEKRRARRVSLRTPVVVACEHYWQEVAQSRDVSPLGIKLALAHQVEPGTLLQLKLAMPRQLRTRDYDDELYLVSAFVIYVNQEGAEQLVVAEFV